MKRSSILILIVMTLTLSACGRSTGNVVIPSGGEIPIEHEEMEKDEPEDEISVEREDMEIDEPEGEISVEREISKESNSTSESSNDGNEEERKQDYGVYLSTDGSQTDLLPACEVIVIDAQYFSREEIASLKTRCSSVYSYINVGALEDFRTYYSDYEDLALGPYENWEEEVWIDVSDVRWQDFIKGLSAELLNKGIDGFFVDNCDVCYYYESESIYQGLEAILTEMNSLQKAVIINGGDTFVKTYYDRHQTLDGVLTGVNQETVFSRIDFDGGEYGQPSYEEDREYYMEYIQLVADDEKEVFLLEYTRAPELLSQIKEFCDTKGYRYYSAASIELDIECVSQLPQ